MIGLLKRSNKHFMYFAVGAAGTFSIFKDLLKVSAATSYLTGISYAALTWTVAILSIFLYALIARVLVTISFRISGAVFTRNNGMFSPFPIGFRDYESTALAFALPCFLIGGLVVLPALFLPTLSRVLDPIRTVTNWVFLALGASFFVKHNGHDYDRKSLAISLAVIPLVLLGLSLILLISEVAR